jgi:hypothetical protein
MAVEKRSKRGGALKTTGLTNNCGAPISLYIYEEKAEFFVTRGFGAKVVWWAFPTE